MKIESPNPSTIVWFNNRFVPLAEANVNILTHGLNYGTAVFEGIRGYFDEGARELFLVRVRDHYDRWKKNAGIIRIDIAASARELCEITAELCRRNRFQTDVYVRPIAYKSSARIGLAPDQNDSYAIVAVPFGSYFDSGVGLKAGVVSWRRIEDSAIPARAKICGAYVNSALATDEARRAGHDEAIFLTHSGHVAEGATCNIFMVRGNTLVTPPSTDDILEGITRASVMELARAELKLEVVERSINRSELYVCDELFFTGTAVEVAPIVRVDFRPVGAGVVGPVAERLKSLYADATRGKLQRYRSWISPVYGSAQPPKTDETVTKIFVNTNV
jgi:branched-chain amino acid aminotransferase